jgi:hypothetical protein
MTMGDQGKTHPADIAYMLGMIAAFLHDRFKNRDLRMGREWVGGSTTSAITFNSPFGPYRLRLTIEDVGEYTP